MIIDPLKHKTEFDRIKREFQNTLNIDIKEYNCKNEKLKEYNYQFAFSIDKIILDIKLTFIICIPKYFPIEFPDVFLEDWSQLGKNIPHLRNDGFICTFDKDVCSPNVNKDIEVIFAIFNKAVSSVRNGILGINQIDFYEEFLAYWELKIGKIGGIIKNFFVPTDNIQELEFYHKNNTEAYIFQNESKALNFISNTKMSISQFDKQKILYIPLGEMTIFPQIKKTNEILSILKQKYGESILKRINQCYNKESKYPIILNSLKKDDQYILFAWKPEFIKKQVDGYRNSMLDFSMIAFGADNDIVRFSICRIDILGLLKGIGVDAKSIINKSITIIGCGSVGSYIAYFLAKSGFKKFNLVDNDTLRIENIARHVCGYRYLNIPKTSALENHLQENFPDVEISVYQDNVLDILSDKNILREIQNCDLCIIATGSFLIDQQIDNTMKCNKVFVWLEPFGEIGQQIYLPENSSVKFLSLHDDNYKYKFSQIINAESYSQREAGCQRSFTPYSLNNLSLFVDIAIKNILKVFNENMIDPIAWTWIGSIKEMQENKVQIKGNLKEFQLIEYLKTSLELIE